MDQRTIDLIDYTKGQLGLERYYLARHEFYRKVNMFNETEYTLSMEWFPNYLAGWDDEELNPDGAAVVSINVKNKAFESIVFVGGKSYADGKMITKINLSEVVQWVENKTGLIHNEHFQLHKEEDGEFQFRQCIDGTKISPSGHIEVKFNHEGQLLSFSIFGDLPTEQMVINEEYKLAIDQIEHIAKSQLRLLDFPSFEKEQLVRLFALEEIYIMNSNMNTIPFEVFSDVRSYLQVNEVMKWEEVIEEKFERKEFQLTEDVSAEQAFSNEQSIDSLPITPIEKKKCIDAVLRLLQQEYSHESGKWLFESLHRDVGSIQAILRLKNESGVVFKRKLTVIIDAYDFKAINYIDNEMMFEMFEQFSAPKEAILTTEQAFEKLKDTFTLEPYYVYDFKLQRYILCGKLDSNIAVDASTGEMIALDDI